MKIAIDARWIFPEISGIGSHTQELIRHIADIDDRNNYVLLFDNDSVRQRTVEETGIGNKTNFSTRLVSYGLFSIPNQLFLPGLLAREKLDIFHSTNYMIPLRSFPRHKPGKIKCITTIHDVIPLAFPGHTPKAMKTRLFPIYRWLMKEIGARSNAIITVSNASRNDIIKHLHIPAQSADKVRTIYNGVSRAFKPAPENKSLSTINHRPLTILYVGRSDPYKNLVNLMEAFKIVRDNMTEPVSLTIAGAPDPRYPEAREAADRLKVSDAVTWTGYLPQEGLLSVYQEADVLAHPSRYEGFGLQIIEAMSCGTPVVCSNAASLPEVAGDAAVILDPNDINGFAEQIKKVLTDQKFSSELTRKGLEQAKNFSWERTAKETVELYAEISG